jgi:RimJ/RimL family protein N-acetyltransferase
MQERLLAAVRQLKETPPAPASWVPVFQYGRRVAWLVPVTRGDLGQPEAVSRLSRWRQAAADDLPGPFPLTEEGTRRWLAEHILGAGDRLLFWVRDLDGTSVGHVGLSGLDLEGGQVEIDQVVRGQPEALPGVMYSSVQALVAWAFQTFPVQRITLQVSADNTRALRLSRWCGFEDHPGQEPDPAGADPKRKGRGPIRLSLCRAIWMSAHALEKAA